LRDILYHPTDSYKKIVEFVSETINLLIKFYIQKRYKIFKMQPQLF